MDFYHTKFMVAMQQNKFHTDIMINWLKIQTDNLFLYVPFILAFGGSAYFCMNMEPTAILTITIFAIMGGLFLFRRRGIIARGAMLFGVGFLYAMAYTYIIATPIMPRTIRDVRVNADVVNIDFTTDKPRVFLRINSGDIGLEHTRSATVRVSATQDISNLNIGDKINTTVSLFRPSPADAPGTFDMARWAYFNGISATGFMTDFEIVAPAKHTTVNNLRAYLHRQSNSVLVDGLVLGYKNTLGDSERAIWTTAGIGHVWAISGFHMALVGAWLFAIFLTLVRLITPITRRVPGRKVAICASIVCLGAYLMISGASVATTRAFFMTALVGVAFLIGRGAFSLRNICLVMCVIFFINPYSVMQVGFQLSFAAVFGIVWFWNEVNPTMPHNKILRVICVAALTSVIATIFTAPFIIAHFNNIQLYGLIGNLILLPVFSFLIMPLVLIGTMCACVGIHFPLDIATSIYDLCFRVAGAIANMPAANITMPYTPNVAMIFFIVGFMAIVLIRPVRAITQYIIFCVCIVIGGIIIATSPRPVFMTTTDNELVAFFDGANIAFNKARDANHYFAFSTWKKIVGVNPDTPNSRYKHNHGVYRFNTKNFNLVYIQKFVPLQQNIVQLCNDADIDFIVSYFDINAPMCRHKILRGGFVIYETGRVSYTPTTRRWHCNRRT